MKQVKGETIVCVICKIEGIADEDRDCGCGKDHPRVCVRCAADIVQSFMYCISSDEEKANNLAVRGYRIIGDNLPGVRQPQFIPIFF